MKRLLLLALFTGNLFNLKSTQAQGKWEYDVSKHNVWSEFGVKAGGNFQQFAGYPFSPDYNTGFMAGLFLERCWNVFGLRAEVTGTTGHVLSEFPASRHYTLSHDVATDTSSKIDLNMAFVNIPVMAEIKAGKHFTIMFGGQYSMLLMTNDNNGAYTKVGKPEELFKKSYISALTGLEITIGKKLRVGGNYIFGVTDLNNQKIAGLEGKWMTGGPQAYLAYQLDKWSWWNKLK